MGQVGGGYGDEERQYIDILLISNDGNTLESIEDLIGETRLRNRLIVARNSTEAVNYLSSSIHRAQSKGNWAEAPRLILLDQNAPDSRGTLHALRTSNLFMTLPIVVITDGLDEEDLRYTVRHGVTGYFLQPIDAGQVRKVVRDVEDQMNLLWRTPCAN